MGVRVGNLESALKHGRILDICLRLLDGDEITKVDAAQLYGITERSIQRDIDDLRSFFSERTAQEGVAREIVSCLIKPVGLMFSEFYFYMTAFIERLDVNEEHKETLSPTIYRIGRIKGYRVLNEHFSVPYKDRFQEGEFRKRRKGR